MVENNNSLVLRVLANSNSAKFIDAATEWRVVGVAIDDSCSGECICGKEQLKYLFKIRNVYNGNILYPIGSSCIEKFGQQELSSDVKICEQEIKLYQRFKNGEFVKLTTEFFSRRLIEHLFLQNAFPASEYNNQNGENDYEFLVKMFNARTTPTDKQQKKINALIVGPIRKFVLEKYRGRDIGGQGGQDGISGQDKQGPSFGE